MSSYIEVFPTAGQMQLNRIVGAYSRAIVLEATYNVSLTGLKNTFQQTRLTLTAAFEAL